MLDLFHRSCEPRRRERIRVVGNTVPNQGIMIGRKEVIIKAERSDGALTAPSSNLINARSV